MQASLACLGTGAVRTRRDLVISILSGVLLAFYLWHAPMEMVGQIRQSAPTRPVRRVPTLDLSRPPIFQVSGGKTEIPRQRTPSRERYIGRQEPPEPDKSVGWQDPPEPDLPANQAQIDAILNRLGKKQVGNLYAKVTPSRPTAPNRAALVFVAMDNVDTGNGYSVWQGVLNSPR
jgi:hypothetical protein